MTPGFWLGLATSGVGTAARPASSSCGHRQGEAPAWVGCGWAAGVPWVQHSIFMHLAEPSAVLLLPLRAQVRIRAHGFQHDDAACQVLSPPRGTPWVAGVQWERG